MDFVNTAFPEYVYDDITHGGEQRALQLMWDRITGKSILSGQYALLLAEYTSHPNVQLGSLFGHQFTGVDDIIKRELNQQASVGMKGLLPHDWGVYPCGLTSCYVVTDKAIYLTEWSSATTLFTGCGSQHIASALEKLYQHHAPSKEDYYIRLEKGKDEVRLYNFFISEKNKRNFK